MSFSTEDDIPNAHLDMSPVKKERLKKAEKEAVRRTLRNTLPVLTRKEIRRFRMPYYKAILADLEEAGFISSTEFIKQLLVLQADNRKKGGPGSNVWMQPQLKDSKANLDLLVQSLSNAEGAHNSSKFAVEWDELVRLAAHYAFGPDDWWWLGEQILFQCVSMNYTEEFNKQEAISHFIIGKYLVENGKKLDVGKYYLDHAREMAEGKSWNCSKILNKRQDIVFIESCRLLHRSLTEEAVTMMKTDPLQAIDICNIARKRAAEACEHQKEAEALLLRGRCELLLNKSSEAIATVTKALNRSTRRKLIKGMCEARIALALAYLQHGKTDLCHENLQALQEIAEEHNLPFYVAQAYRFMGEYFLNQKQCYQATPYIMLAFYIFHEIKDLRRRERVRTWAAISAGEELFPAFINLIQKCADTEDGKKPLLKIIRWIDGKEHFWTHQSKFSFSYDALKQNIIQDNDPE